ncbi:hypothetical protein CANCADRAFT_3899 [Tortispora caseinolytica NRRL Y-17796]|uniref:Importin N-terminal domain-containing protein n=1 Tax=Tortispora caseinolytica NRRL Y-17796 TaxID=767744 RepID=A0A1E4TBY1_9ASCO|nr:hypothetical protein CANCADRAFT_3899 [Tortispora caseinolytica NRRL Y-17796]
MEQLVQILRNTLNGATQSDAEVQLVNMSLTHPQELVDGLVQLCALTSLDLPTRLAALINLRQLALRKWSPAIEQFEGPLLDQQTKQKIRHLFLSAVSAPEYQIRSTAAYAVAKIAAVDFPDDWPELMPSLMNILLKSTEDAMLLGALTVLKDMLDNSFTIEQYIDVADDLSSALLRLILNSSSIVCAEALEVLESCLSMYALKDEINPSAVSRFTTFLRRSVFPALIALIEKPVRSPEDETILYQYTGFRIYAHLETIFPELLEEHLTQLAPIIYLKLAKIVPLYGQRYIDNEVDEEFEVSNPQSLIKVTFKQYTYELAELFRTFLIKGKVKKMFHPSSEEFKSLFSLILEFAQLPTFLYNEWSDDYNAFVSEEMDLSVSYNSRNVTADIISQLCTYSSDALLALAYDAAVATAYSDQSRHQEATLYILCLIYSELDEDQLPKQDETSFNNLMQYIMSCLDSQNPLLQARAVIFASRLFEVADTNSHLNQLVNLLNAVYNPQFLSDPLRICAACIAWQRFTSASQSHLGSYIHPILNSINSIIDTATDDTPVLLVDAILAAIKLDLKVLPDSQFLATELILQITLANAADAQLRADSAAAFSDIIELFEPEVFDSYYFNLCKSTFKKLQDLVFDVPQDPMSPEVLAAFEIIQAILEAGHGPLPYGIIEACLRLIVPPLINTADPETVGYGCDCIISILDRDVDHLRGLNQVEIVPGQPRSVLEIILDVAAKALDPSMDASATGPGARMISAVITHMSTYIMPYLPQIIQATVRCIISADRDLMIISLMDIFVTLTLVSAQETIEYLSSTTFEDTKNPERHVTGLEVVLKAWLSSIEAVGKTRDIAKYYRALYMLFASNDERLWQIEVDGDLIITENEKEKIITRSMAKSMPKRYTQVAVPVKILKVMLNDAKGRLDSGATKPDAARIAGIAIDNDEDEGELDEWEDVDAGNMTIKDLAQLADQDTVDQYNDGDGGDEIVDLVRSILKDCLQNNRPGVERAYNQLTQSDKKVWETLISY